MPEVAAPLWLALIPPLTFAVWWLHRYRERAPRIRVSAIFIWRGLEHSEAPGNRRDRAEPAWLLRSLILSLLLLALSGIGWTSRSGHPVTIWFDDSLSMKAVESNGIRWSLAAARLVRALRQAGVSRAEIRSLSHPDRRLQLHRDQWDDLASHLESWFRDPPLHANGKLPSLPLAPGEHWLVTDGTYPGLTSWLTRARLQKVMQVGKATENSAVSLLGLRRALDSPDRIQGVVQAWNGGHHDMDRKLILLRNEQEFQQWQLTIPRGGTATRNFVLPVDEPYHLEARLLPPIEPDVDHLAPDDRLELKVLPDDWKMKVSLDGNCSTALEVALDALPGTTLAHDGSDITVVCSSNPPINRHLPVIWFPDQPHAAVPEGPLHWSPGVTDIDWPFLENQWLRTATGASPAVGAEPLLSAGERPLILRYKAEHPMLEVRLDMEAPSFVQQPAYPLLIARLFELALGHALLDQIMSVRRDPSESRIAPPSLPRPAPNPSPARHQPETTDVSGWLILLALGLLFYDLGRTVSLHHRRHSGAKAGWI